MSNSINQNVIAINGYIATTNSLLVSEYFGIQHSEVLRKIRAILKHQAQANFSLSKYTDKSGKKNIMYIMDVHGFIRLTMSYNSPKANKLKDQYISAFEQIQTELHTKLRSEQLQLSTKENKQKIEFANQLLKSKDGIDFATASKAMNLGYGKNTLLKKCRKLKILNSKNVPKQEYIDQGYFKVLENFLYAEDVPVVFFQPLITPKGQKWLLTKLK